MTHGTDQVQTSPKPGGSEQVQPVVQPSGGGSPEGTPDDGSGANDPTTGTAGGVSGGDRHQHAGDDTEEENKNRLLKVAVESLDHANDDHWTAEGRPRIDAIETAYGKPGVSRAMVEKVMPDFVRRS